MTTYDILNEAKYNAMKESERLFDVQAANQNTCCKHGIDYMPVNDAIQADRDAINEDISRIDQLQKFLAPIKPHLGRPGRERRNLTAAELEEARKLYNKYSPV